MIDLKNLVTRYIENVCNKGKLKTLSELTADVFVYHLGSQPPQNRTAMQQFLHSVRSAFPDWQLEVEEMISSENKVAVRWTGSATHRGVFQRISPTGKKVFVRGINMYRFADGRIAEEWEQMDSLGLLQLGVVPANSR